MLLKNRVEIMREQTSAQRSWKMITFQWVPLISTLSLGVVFIVLAYCFAMLAV